MPELPEVETVKNTLKKLVLNKKIMYCDVYWDNIIAYPDVKTFKNNIKNQTIHDILRRGKWLMFKLDDYYLLSHLRMEGKYFLKEKDEQSSKHEHVVFNFENDKLCYHDTRKFGKMYLIEKDKVYNTKPLNNLGKEPWDIDIDYLKSKLNKKPIKTELLDQSIVVGIGNIYVDEILFLSKINPNKKANNLNDKELENIIKFTKETLERAIKLGGSTIKSYTSSGIHGKFQNELLVHTKEVCPICSNKIEKIKIGGRGTYYCPNCQKDKTI